jgi:TolB-like protein/Tfp pilus assembly protein PilF
MTDTPTEREEVGAWARLRRRKVVQWGLAYAAGAWALLQAIGFFADTFHWPEPAKQFAAIALIVGLPIVLTLAWYHGDKGQQRITRDEVAILTLLFLLGGALFWYFQRTSIVPEAQVQAQSAPPSAVAPVALPNDRSIAVLPFVNMSSDREQEYFADGISEEVLNLLTQVPQLRVIARTSSFSFKGKEADIAEIAKKLNVAHVLEGSVRRSNDTVRITAQLIRASDSSHLWSETYDRKLTDVFAVQDEIAAAVVTQMKVTLLGEVPKSRVTDPQAYTKFLQARHLTTQWTPEGFNKSTELYREVLAADPNYVEAWRMLATNSLNEGAFGLRPLDESCRSAREYVNKVLAIDPHYGRGHDGLALIALTCDLDLWMAAREWSTALELDPTNESIRFNVAFFLMSLGQAEQAVAVLRDLISRNPLSASTYVFLGMAYYLGGRWDEAADAFRTAISLSPNVLGARAGLGGMLLAKGNKDGALEIANAEPSEVQRLRVLAVIAHAQGKRAESEAALAQLISKYQGSAAYYIATVYAVRGENDSAFQWLEKAVPDVVLVTVDPALVKLHEDSRWLPFLRKLGMAPEQLAAIKFDVKLLE